MLNSRHKSFSNSKTIGTTQKKGIFDRIKKFIATKFTKPEDRERKYNELREKAISLYKDKLIRDYNSKGKRSINYSFYGTNKDNLELQLANFLNYKNKLKEIEPR